MRRLLFTLVGSVGLLGGILFASSPVMASSRQASNIPKGGHDALDVSVYKSGDIGKTQFPNLYGGVVLTNNGKHINVYLTKLSKNAEKAIRHGAKSKLFTFIKTPHSKKQLLQIHHTVSQNAKTLFSKGIHLVSNGPDIKTGKEEINVANLTPSQKKYILKKFGKSNVEVNSVGTSSIPHLTASRSSDSAPWNGGDFITDDSTGDCTDGFGVHTTTQAFLLTAGHCYSTGTSVYNGAMTLGLGSFSYMGSVSGNGTSNEIDSALISASGGSSKLIWSGSSSNPVRDAVSGTSSVVVGDQVCQSGAFDGELCGLVVQNADMTIYPDNGKYTFTHEVEASNTSGGIANGAGDSGGPVFRWIGSYLYAVGTVSAGSGSTTCTNYPNNRQCYTNLYYENINNILNYFGVSINT
ncbi:S1 family peptidase [Alicyclobacillus sp. SO9]|uniref:S1 family peptidase n=1 Tax=Alicyclobacillus sp. SO9 TaxID=2665646 RepID=UPI0018E831A1|nr:S1 family peptidase [Alicyclobacillus sp. SO9]QQE79552.1 trypsin-like serine protease [Alicyclobacillus sp. SO9]